MKKTIMILMGTIILMSALYATTKENSTNGNGFVHAIFLWTETVHDFGKIKQNVPVTHEFTFTNNGETELLITSVKASCGCTVTEYTKDPIPAGAKGLVKATYNAAKTGIFTKSITVNANTQEGSVQLTIKGEVIE